MLAPVPDPAKPFEAQDPCILLGMCIFGEARGESYPAKLGVGCVVRNRMLAKGKYGQDYSGVILKPWQFSSFNENDPNRAKLLAPLEHDVESVWALCYSAALAVFCGGCEDATGGAVFYHDSSLLQAPRAWGSVQHTVRIGRLQFYRENFRE
jgi:N-acetylmuramoyl-L-alanine amidase